MSRTITQKFKHQWCFRAFVWRPEGGRHGSMEIEGPLTEEIGKALMTILAGIGRFRTDKKLRDELVSLADKIRMKNNVDAGERELEDARVSEK